MLNRLVSFLRTSVAPLLISMPLAAGAAGNVIVIGQAIDLSGPNASIGRDYVAGIKTCFDMVNASGGINGKRIQFIARDDRGQPDLSARLASELVEREQVDYLMGGVGDDATTAILNAPAFRRSGHMLFAPLAAADYPASSHVMFWRPSYKQEIRHILRHFSKVGISSVGVVVQATSLNEQAFRSLNASMEEQGVTVAGLVRIGAQGDRIAEEAARLAKLRPGFVIILADTIASAQFLKAYRAHDTQTFVAGTSLTNLSTLRELAGARALEWSVFSQVVPDPAGARTQLQVEHLNGMKKYRDEAVSSLTLEGFAAAKALVRAIQQSKRGGRTAFQELALQNGTIDLGGLSMTSSSGSNRLSDYVEIALFRKGSGLMY